VLAVQAAELMAVEAAERKREGGKKAGRGRPLASPSKEGKLIARKARQTTTRAAAAVKAGVNQVETMAAVKKSAPEVFAAVQQGGEPKKALGVFRTLGRTPAYSDTVWLVFGWILRFWLRIQRVFCHNYVEQLLACFWLPARPDEIERALQLEAVPEPMPVAERVAAAAEVRWSKDDATPHDEGMHHPQRHATAERLRAITRAPDAVKDAYREAA
jgi:hypothetical protein